MSIPSTVRRYLAKRGEQFMLRTVPAEVGVVEAAGMAAIPAEQLACAVMVKSGVTPLMVIMRGDRQVDLEQLATLFKRPFELCSREESESHCIECDSQWLPPLPEAFGLKAIVDRELNDLDEVFFPAGIPGHFIRTSGRAFYSMLENGWRDYIVTCLPESEVEQGRLDINDIYRHKVQALKRLPPMPGMAAEIVRIRNNPYAMASELAAVIEQDPSLAAQLIRYATSPLYNYQGKIDSLEEAIVRVLGMDFVTDFAFGLLLGKTFHNPQEGPIGLKAYWRHALHTASLAQALCSEIEFTRRPSAGMAYLAGLLHNMGFLLLGHLFPSQFEHLNRAIAEQPQRPITELEAEVLGVSHTEIGLWLMEAWQMPQEVAVAVQHHHDCDYHGDYAAYANLVTIANRLLKRYQIGDAETDEIPQSLLDAVGLERAALESALAKVMADSEGLLFMAGKMAA